MIDSHFRLPPARLSNNGVAGNGLSELEDVIAGLRPVTDGRIFHNGDDITELTPRETP